MTRRTLTSRLRKKRRALKTKQAGASFFVGQDFGVGDARMVVDRQMHRLPSDPAGVALAVPVASDAVTDAIELAELLDVDVEDLARGGALITADRLGRLERGQAVEAQPFQDAAGHCHVWQEE